MENLGTESSSLTWQREDQGDQAAGRQEVGCATPSPASAQTVQRQGRGAEPSLSSSLAPPWGSSSPNPHHTPRGAHFNDLVG